MTSSSGYFLWILVLLLPPNFNIKYPTEWWDFIRNCENWKKNSPAEKKNHFLKEMDPNNIKHLLAEEATLSYLIYQAATYLFNNKTS